MVLVIVQFDCHHELLIIMELQLLVLYLIYENVSTNQMQIKNFMGHSQNKDYFWLHEVYG